MPINYKIYGRSARYNKTYNAAARTLQRNLSKLHHRRKQRSLRRQVKLIRQKLYMNSDNRWKDTWWTSQSMPSTATILDIMDLGGIIQGDNIDQRAGNQITLKNMYLSFNFLGSDAYNNMRIILFSIPCSQAGTLPTVDQILAQVTTLPIALPSVQSPYTKNSTLEFKIILDHKFSLQRQAAGAVRPPNHWKTIKHKFPNGGHPVHYETGTATPPIKGNIYMLFISDSQAPPHPNFTCYARLNYSG